MGFKRDVRAGNMLHGLLCSVNQRLSIRSSYICLPILFSPANCRQYHGNSIGEATTLLSM